MLFYMHMQKASQKLKYMMDQVSQWLTKSCLYLNVKKNIGIVFLLKGYRDVEADMFVQGGSI